jgi:hypothetical protein
MPIAEPSGHVQWLEVSIDGAHEDRVVDAVPKRTFQPEWAMFGPNRVGIPGTFLEIVQRPGYSGWITGSDGSISIRFKGALLGRRLVSYSVGSVHPLLGGYVALVGTGLEVYSVAGDKYLGIKGLGFSDLRPTGRGSSR